MDDRNLISASFKAFLEEAPEHAQAWGAMVQGLNQATALDPKTAALAYLAVLASQKQQSGIPFHVREAKRAGASREEVVSAILIGLPAAGHRVTHCLPQAVEAYDKEED